MKTKTVKTSKKTYYYEYKPIDYTAEENISTYITIKSGNGTMQVDNFKELKEQGFKCCMIEISNTFSKVNRSIKMHTTGAIAWDFQIGFIHKTNFLNPQMEAEYYMKQVLEVTKRHNLNPENIIYCIEPSLKSNKHGVKKIVHTIDIFQETIIQNGGKKIWLRANADFLNKSKLREVYTTIPLWYVGAKKLAPPKWWNECIAINDKKYILNP